MSFGTTTPLLASRPTGAMPCREQLSAPWDLDWESYRASMDVLQREDIFATPLKSAPISNDMQLPTICIASAGTTTSVSPDFKIRTPDRFTVDLAEHRRGYSYSVQMETPDHCKAAAMEQDCVTPRRALDKENSDDFSSFAGLQAGPGTAALFGGYGYAGPASSPFAAHTRQPFGDGASTRSRLSDYGYDTASDDEGEAEEQLLRGMAHALKPARQQQPPKSPLPGECAGFWADVGASGGQLADGSSGDSMPKQVDGPELEVGEPENGFGSIVFRKPEDTECAHGTHPQNAGVLLPWDMD